METVRISIYRYNPEKDQKPYMQEYELELDADKMVLDALKMVKAQDESLSFRHSCGEGVCGSDGLNINGTNGLSCITAIADLEQPIEVAAKPYLIVKDPEPEVEFKQTPAEREKLDGLYECVLCGSCSTACPSFWWNPDKFLGPAALLQSYRFLADSRDQATDERLDDMEDAYKLYRCHTIMNCVQVCPKGLNPTNAIGKIKHMMLKQLT